MKTFQFKLGAVLLASSMLFTSCDKDETDPTPDPSPQLQTIAEIANDNGNFTILLDALSRTGLDAVMADPSMNLTVFAPNDAAFMDLLTELNLNSLDEVETALGNDGLKNVLLYHVLDAMSPHDQYLRLTQS
mgnify:CR=1 FL=1